MRGALPLAIVLLATFLTGTAAASTDSVPHVRGVNASGRDLMGMAQARSTVVRTLIDALEATDVVALVSVEPLPSRFPMGFLAFVSAAGGVRYVAVKVNSNSYPVERVITLAHELQHALEVAAASDVRDTPSLARLYDRIGYQVGPGKWETDAARRAGYRAQSELNGDKPEASPFGIPVSQASPHRRAGPQH